MITDKKGVDKYITLLVLVGLGIGLMYISLQNIQQNERILKNQENNVILFLEKINHLLEENEDHLKVTINELKSNRNHTHGEIIDLTLVLNTTVEELRELKGIINNLNNTN